MGVASPLRQQHGGGVRGRDDQCFFGRNPHAGNGNNALSPPSARAKAEPDANDDGRAAATAAFAGDKNQHPARHNRSRNLVDDIDEEDSAFELLWSIRVSSWYIYLRRVVLLEVSGAILLRKMNRSRTEETSNRWGSGFALYPGVPKCWLFLARIVGEGNIHFYFDHPCQRRKVPCVKT